MANDGHATEKTCALRLHAEAISAAGGGGVPANLSERSTLFFATDVMSACNPDMSFPPLARSFSSSLSTRTQSPASAAANRRASHARAAAHSSSARFCASESSTAIRRTPAAPSDASFSLYRGVRELTRGLRFATTVRSLWLDGELRT